MAREARARVESGSCKLDLINDRQSAHYETTGSAIKLACTIFLPAGYRNVYRNERGREGEEKKEISIRTSWQNGKDRLSGKWSLFFLV